METKLIPHRKILYAPLPITVFACALILLSFVGIINYFLGRQGEQDNTTEDFLENIESSFFPHFNNNSNSDKVTDTSEIPSHTNQNPDSSANDSADNNYSYAPSGDHSGESSSEQTTIQNPDMVAGDSSDNEYSYDPSDNHSGESSSEQTTNETNTPDYPSETVPDDPENSETSTVKPIIFENYPYSSEKDFVFTSDNSGITINGYTGKNTIVRIPPKINGLTVKVIGKAAFYQNPSITHIQIPNGVEFIGEAAFYNCISLTQLSCPSTLIEIQNDAFRECYRLKYVELAEGLLSLLAYVFQDCRSLTEIVLPSTLKSIGADTFAGTSIDVLTLPVSLDSCAVFGYGGWPALTEIRVAEGNSQFYAKDGVLFMHYKTHEALWCYPPGKRASAYTVENAEIAAYAFSGNKYLEEVTIGENVFVSSYAFNECNKLKTVRCARQVSGFGSYSFGNCPSLSEVFLPEVITTEFCSDAFAGSAGLRKLVFPSALTLMPNDGNLLNDLPNAALYVTAGSPAEAYAQRYGLPYTIY